MNRRAVSFLKLHQVSLHHAAGAPIQRCFSTVSQRQSDSPKENESNEAPQTQKEPEEESAMARRLSEMTEQAMLEGGRSAQKNMQQAGFSEDLKKQLEERIAATSFKNDYAAAHSVVNMPTSAGKGTQDIAGAEPWQGTENLHDITLRMLDDAKPKPIRRPFKAPQLGQLKPVDMRITPKPKLSPGVRIAQAKERTATYELSQSPGVSDREREALRKEMRERFEPGGRPMPVTIQGFTSLANERIEDAMARGQFERIKRGKGVNTQTDHNANSAFINTTEYFMNKMIQKQELVPPWIEKQQDLAKETQRFRDRMRTEWRRHAARIIASQGGSLEDQMKRARAYAAAEARLADRAAIERSFSDAGEPEAPSTEEASTEKSAETQETEDLPYVEPLRDPNYLAIERPFFDLTIKTINDQTRTYNLQAPPVAQKPYLNLDRELAACYAEVAPTLAEEIKRRTLETAHGGSTGPKAAGIIESLSASNTSTVYDEDEAKGYGFKQFWRDLFSKK